MKKIIVLFLLFGAFTFAQQRGCVWESAVDTTGETDYYECNKVTEFFYLTLALPDSADTVTVWSGTNKVDSAYTAEDYTQVSLKNISDGTIYTEITGDEARHTYLILWAYKRPNIMIKGTALSDTTAYTLEGY